MKIILEQSDTAEPVVVIRCADPDAEIITAIKMSLQELDKQILIQQTDTLTLLQPRSILYCEYVNRRVFVYTAEDLFPCSLSLQQLVEQFPDFVRCSKSAVVNIRQLTHLKSEVHGRILATLSNGEQLLISRHYASTLRKRLKEK